MPRVQRLKLFKPFVLRFHDVLDDRIHEIQNSDLMEPRMYQPVVPFSVAAEAFSDGRHMSQNVNGPTLSATSFH